MLNKLALGTVQFGLNYGISNKNGKTPTNEVSRILSAAKEFGIDIIDTAYAYGNSQEVLGQVGVNGFKVVSKFIPPTESVTLGAQVQTTLELLGVESLYAMLAHRPLSVTENPKLWDDLLQFKQSGKIQKIGFSFNTQAEAHAVLSAGYIPDLVQVPFNYFDRRFVKIIRDLKATGCEIHTRSAFLQGLFFLNPNELPSFFNPVKDLLTDIQQNYKPVEGALLNFCINQDFIDRVVFGVNNQEQLLQNINSINEAKPLPELTTSIPDEILTPSMWPK